MNRIHLMGLDFNTGTFNEVIDEVREEKFRNSDRYPFLITPNADQVLQYNKLPELKRFFEHSYFILPDGFPIIVYSKVVKKPLAGRLAGSDLFPMLWKMSVNENRKVFVIAPDKQVGDLLTREYPQVRYYVPGLLNLKDMGSMEAEADKIISLMNGAEFDYLMIGLGFPKQETLTMLVYKKMTGKKPLIMLLGASFEFYLGLKKRAPKWISKIGFEWLHRLLSEPGRLWKRYTIGNFNFLVFFIQQYFKERKA
jgi:N-acetylglucosaminyldiphosphoundecaprenol N-acetyl-beta-D-mannosaminyltransferase